MIHEVTETPRKARRQASIERILDAAEEIVAVEGFDALTMHRTNSRIWRKPQLLYKTQE